jgi:hypothetical protein
MDKSLGNRQVHLKGGSYDLECDLLIETVRESVQGGASVTQQLFNRIPCDSFGGGL